jgi:hypothetical protein
MGNPSTTQNYFSVIFYENSIIEIREMVGTFTEIIMNKSKKFHSSGGANLRLYYQ